MEQQIVDAVQMAVARVEVAALFGSMIGLGGAVVYGVIAWWEGRK